MNQETTEHLGLTLPHPNNLLAVDVLRLREALIAVDLALSAVQQLVAQKADANQVQQALQQLQLAVSALGTEKVASVNGLTGVSITLRPEHIDLGPANGPENVQYSYDEAGRITQITQSIKDNMSITAISYDEAGRITQKQIAYKGRLRTESIIYDQAGRVQNVTSNEVEVSV